MSETTTPTEAPPEDRRIRLHWWTEVIAIVAVYLVYTAIRNRFGSATVGAEHAFNNARHVIDVERRFGLFFEENFQDVFLGHRFFLQFWNVFYGTFHFWVTGFALVFTYRRFPERYPLWRNTLVFTTLLGLIGFAFFPLMPPRLLDDCGVYGACASYGFVDTLARYGGLWSFDSGTMQSLSNQYAAMPSLHFAWSTWCFLVLFHELPWRPARVAVALYPLVTLFAIVVTANHYWLDAAGGALALAGGFAIAWALHRVVIRRRGTRSPEASLLA
jgi:PAP2 superfamily